MTENNLPTRPIIAFYTAYPWDRSLPIVRAIGPLQNAGFQILRGNDWETRAFYLEEAKRADLILVQRDFAGERAYFEEILRLARSTGKKLIFDLDDLLIELPEDHPDRSINYYSHSLVPIIQAMLEADAVTVSTPALAEYVRPYNSNVYLLQNYLNDTLWKIHPPLPDEQNEKIVLGFIGGDSHLPDLQMIEPVLARLFDQYADKLSVRIWGMDPPASLKRFSQVEVGEFIPSYAQFAARAQQIGCQIFLAPLQDNLFNRHKSWIKFLEYSSMGVPGIYSDLEPYQKVISNGQNGILASSLDEWENALRLLIDNPALRAQMASNAQQTLVQEWLLSKNAYRWSDTYAEISRQQHHIGEDNFHERLVAQIKQLQHESDLALIKEQERVIQHLRAQVEEKDKAVEQAQSRVAEIENSRAYRLVQWIWRIRLSLLPYGSRRAQLAGFMFRSFRLILQGIVRLASLLRRPLKERSLSKLIWLDRGNVAASRVTNNSDVIIFPVIDWDFRFQRPQQFAVEFSRQGHRVFYLNTTFRYKKNPRIKQIRENIFEIFLAGTVGLIIYQKSLDEATHAAGLTAFELLRQYFSIKEAVCLVDLPFWTPLVFSLRKKYGWKVIYDCMDKHQAFETNLEEMLVEEEALSRQSDLVLASSNILLKEQIRHNPNTQLVPNAADFDFFHRKPDQLAGEIGDIRHPIIGYYGAISQWFDTNLVSELAKKRPEWNFVLIGRTVGGDLNPLNDLSNVHLMGEKPYSSLTKYLYAFDICIMPFKKTKLTEATNPVKIYEFLSSGKPVVVSNIQELTNFYGLVEFASGVDEWLEKLENGLVEQNADKIQARITFASQNTWKDRVEQIGRALLKIYPLASIIVLSYNNPELTKDCLDSIFEKTTYPSFEVIVVDNASDETTQNFLKDYTKQHDNLKLILNNANLGFAGGMNRGIAVSDGEIILLLNNDVVVTRGWLHRLIWHLESDPAIGLVGPVTNATGNEAKIETSYKNQAEMEKFAEEYTQRNWGLNYPLREFAMYCVAMKCATIEKIGLLDERYTIGMFEDDDYAYRLRQAGYKIVCAQDAFVHHNNLSAFKKLPKEQYLSIFQENRRKFEDKWSVDWQEPHIFARSDLRMCSDQLANILDLHRDRKGVIIFPPTIGWGITLFQRPHHLARAFARQGYLTFFCETESESRSQLGFKGDGQNLFHGWVPWEIFDLVDHPFLILYAYNKDFIFRFRRPRVIFDHIDDLSVFPYDPRKLEKNFHYLVKNAELVVTTADRLLDSVKTVRSDAILVPNGVDYEHFSTAFGRIDAPPSELQKVTELGKPICGYFGALARWFDYDLLELIAKQHKEINFVLIGPDHDGSICSSQILTLPNVFFLGPQEYTVLPQFLAWFDVAMIPFIINDVTLATSPIKLFEYLAAGKPVVTTGMPECRKYFGTFVADSREEFDRFLGLALERANDQEFRVRAREESARQSWTLRTQQIIERLSVGEN